MTCKGICIRHKANRPARLGRYSAGQKRCQVCELFINWHGLWLPCCGYSLRTNPRTIKLKDKLRDTLKIMEYRLNPLSIAKI